MFTVSSFDPDDSTPNFYLEHNAPYDDGRTDAPVLSSDDDSEPDVSVLLSDGESTELSILSDHNYFVTKGAPAVTPQDERLELSSWVTKQEVLSSVEDENCKNPLAHQAKRLRR